MRNGSTISSKDQSLLGVQKMKKEKINFLIQTGNLYKEVNLKTLKKLKNKLNHVKKQDLIIKKKF